MCREKWVFHHVSKASTSLLVKGNYHASLAILQRLPERLSTFGAASTEYSENEIIMQFGLFETKSDLGCSILALTNHAYFKNAKGTKHVPLTMFRFFPCCLEFLNVWLKHSRSSLVFETDNDFIFGMLSTISRIFLLSYNKNQCFRIEAGVIICHIRPKRS